MSSGTTIADKSVLVTGAKPRDWACAVDEALRRGAKRVYVGTRRPLARPDQRIALVTVDVTNATQIQEALESVESLDIVIKNAGIALYDDDLGDRSVLEQQLAVNLFGPYRVAQAFLPL